MKVEMQLKIDFLKSYYFKIYLDIDNENNIIINKDGVYINNNSKALDFVPLKLNINFNDLRAVRLIGNEYSSVMHYTTDESLVLTTKNLKGLVITDKVKLPFKDVKEDDLYYSEINELYNYLFINGQYPLILKFKKFIKFNPDNKITRAEFITMISRALELDNEYKFNNYSFKDIKGKWYADNVQALKDLGIIDGYSNGSFGGKGKLTFEYAVETFVNTLMYLNADKEGLKELVENTISINDKDNITRKEACKILLDVLRLTKFY